MKFVSLLPVLLLATTTPCINAFSLTSPSRHSNLHYYSHPSLLSSQTRPFRTWASTRLALSSSSDSSEASSTSSSELERKKDEQIDRLLSQAAKLRAEAAALEADQAEAMARAAEKAFQKFDTNNDGQITVAELKEGLEKEFKTELSEKRVQQLLADFDKSGDGVLQLDEFVSVDRFRNKLDALAREERAMAIEKKKQASREAEAAKFLEEQVALINDKPPTATDKLISILPYLFPLLDGLQYASFFILKHPDNILSALALVIFTLYRSIPFGGFIAFGVLYFISGNPGINRLVRYNTQQAIFLDIALFFPGLLSAIIGLTNVPLNPALVEVSTDLIFVTLVAAIAYSSISSLLGIYPDKIPIISEAVNDRVPPAETVLKENKEFLKLLTNLSGDDLRAELEKKKKDEKKSDDEKKE